MALALHIVAVACGFTATFDEYMPLEGILSRKALVAMGAGERFHCQMNTLVAFQIMVSVEALRALIALEWPIIGGLLLRRVAKHVAHACRVSTVESWNHLVGYTADKSKLAVGVGYIGEDRCLRIAHSSTIWPLMLIRMRRLSRGD